ncbi:helix-turn-helix domain-containing protein [Paenibacillus sp. GYB003]|uniref:helix-turn-helix domain-containing protein n=1 Tax=Paenibacillus sp. GYB003 TaxID=2994392 RepID=UPI002F96371D
MKLLNKMNSVFYRLFFSYAALLLATTAAVGATSYVFFTSSLNAEVEKVHARMLSHTADQLSANVLGKAQKLYLDLATRADVRYFFDNPIPGHYAKMKGVADDLKAIAALYPDIVDSVAVYYRDERAVVSSLQGVSFLDSIPGKVAVSTDWIERADRADAPMLWIETRRVPVNVSSDGAGAELVTLVGAYPYNSAGRSAKGYYAVNLKADAIADLIRISDETDRGQQWIVDRSGHTIAFGNSRLGAMAEESAEPLREIGAAGQERGSLSRTLGGVDYLLTYTTLPYNGWRLIQATPVDDYNKNATAIQRTLLLICVAAIALGLIVSQALTLGMYSPLKSLLRTVKGMFEPSEPPSGKHENEYKVLDRIVSGLSVKVGELEMTVQENVPIIRHHLVTGLLNSGIAGPEELAERLRLLKMSWPEPYSCALVVRLDDAGAQPLSVGDEQIVVYSLVRELEQAAECFAGCTCTAVAASSNEISAIVRAGEPNERLLAALAEKLFAYAEERFGVRPAAAWGRWVDRPLRLHESYADARTCWKYRYFMPERRLFAWPACTERENSRAELPERLTDEFAEALRARDGERVRSLVDELTERMGRDLLSADYCHEKWKQWVDAYRQYVKQMNLKLTDVVGEDSLDRFQRIANIRDFREWLLDAVRQTFRFVEERGRSRGSESVERVKAYVEANLGRDMSLQVVAECVRLHPRYLSQLFKEETGIGFVDYVNKRRLEAAAHLIKTSDLNVEQIAGTVGFNTPAYFIKKFKEAYGVTPKTYKFNYTVNP